MNFFDKKASGSGVATLANKSTIKYMPHFKNVRRFKEKTKEDMDR